MDVETVNGLAGIAALINSLLMVPAVRALRQIAKGHETRISKLEGRKPKSRGRGRRGVL